MLNKEGQTGVEITILICVVIAGIVIMHTHASKALNQRQTGITISEEMKNCTTKLTDRQCLRIIDNKLNILLERGCDG